MGMLHVALRALLRRSLLLAIACTALLTLFISPRLGSVSSSGDSKDEPRTGHDPQTLPRPTRQSVPPRYAVLAEPSAEESLLESNSRNKGVHSLPAYLRSSQAVFETTVHETRYSLLESDSSSPFGNCIVTATPSSAPPTLHSCSGDQPIHAQTLVHPAMLLHPFPRRTLVLGFPEGSVAKELLRHFTLTSIAWVPWSSESQGSRRDFETIASRFSREYVKASGEHPDHDDLLDRVVIPETDSVKSYLSAQDTTTFDVIFIDADAVHLLPLARSKLRAGGIVAVPGGPASMSANGFKINVESPVETGVGETQYTAFSTLMREFKHVHSGTAFRPSRSELWTYHYATDSDTLPNPTTLHPQLVDIWIARRITGELSQYDGITHAHAFSIPAWLRAELKHATFVAISNGISQRPTPHSRKEDDDVEDEEFENLFGPTVLETPDGTGYEPYLHISSDELPAITPLGGSFFSYDFFGCDTMVLLNSTLLENTLRKGLEIAHAPSAKISVTRFPSLANVTEIDLDDLEDEENESARMSRAPAKHPAVILTATFDGGRGDRGRIPIVQVPFGRRYECQFVGCNRRGCTVPGR
ncbi:hypothetical protein BJ742DRAFT_34448 [Cladochytrium replicatum]|nr:hypothetical protein BJ742DRAFT_34448 [Cladochytrium replicatum]